MPVGTFLATRALDHIIRMASLWDVLTRTTHWRRTNKFWPLPLGALSGVVRALLGLGLVALVVLTDFRPPGLLLLAMVSGPIQGAQYQGAFLPAVLAKHGIPRA